MTAPISRHRISHRWPLLTTLVVGLLAIVAVSLGAWRGAGAFAPAGTPGASPTASPMASPITSPVASPGASPVAGSAAGNNGSGFPGHDAVDAITQRIVHSNPILARVTGPNPGDAVFDPYRILTADQAKSLSGDARRLQGAGLPTLVYIRVSLDNESQSQAFANSLVHKPGLVESSKGAQDGLVVLVSIPPGAPEKSTIAVAHGANALPVNGLDDAAIHQIYEDGMLPRLQKGQIFPALEFGLRKFNYVVAYSPYSTPVLSSTAKTVGRWLGIVAPLAALTAISLLILTWFPAGASWRGPVTNEWRAWLATWWPAVVAGGLCVVLIPLAVYARNRIGIFAAALLIIAILLDVWVTADHPARPRRRRVVTVAPARPDNVVRRRAVLERSRPRRRNRSEGPAA